MNEQLKKEVKSIWVQMWHPGARFWDDCPAIKYDISDAHTFAQSMADHLQCAIRITFISDDDSTPVGNMNGSYFRPKSLWQ